MIVYNSMHIGSGDVNTILMKKETKGFQNFCRKFFSGENPNYNALASPVDALRTGAILEQRYALTLPEGYFPQYEAISPEMDVLLAHLDYALIDAGKVIDFDELKTVFCTDFLKLQPYKEAAYEDYVSFLKSNAIYRHNYTQVQQQLYVTGLQSANLVYLEVQVYNDEANKTRNIQPDELIKFRIKRDEEVIAQIKDRASFFQYIKDYFKN